jgi:chorismate dehydratase
VEDYYRVLDYRFTEERKRSLLLFLSLAARIGLSAPVSQLEFL